jgi:hypothetical protein
LSGGDLRLGRARQGENLGALPMRHLYTVRWRRICMGHHRRAEIFALPHAHESRLSSSSLSLNVEPKLHNVPILNNVLFSFDPELARFSGFRE